MLFALFNSITWRAFSIGYLLLIIYVILTSVILPKVSKKTWEEIDNTKFNIPVCILGLIIFSGCIALVGDIMYFLGHVLANNIR